MTESTFEYHLEEYRSLKSEIEYRVKSTEKIEGIVGLAVVAMYTWLTQNSVPYLVWWMPVVLTVLGAVRQAALLTRIMHVSEYVKRLELEFAHKNLKGWEHFLTKKRKTPSGLLISTSGFAFWLITLVATTAIAINGGF
jgi:hypothetical protein